ncbi:hypothetical protein RRF57_000494 [Xylaria bambusicola]|uniref:Anoctamin transmembrane domain-containing protein n=1 Tax=Xylaria bambusicola TaxID=326684 RepID=A0AAN7UA95_9PEZI
MPFGNLMVPYLQIFATTARTFSSEKSIATQEFRINPDRLKSQMVYSAVTAQLVNVALESVVPYVKRTVLGKVQTKRTGQDATSNQDLPEEHEFLQRVREEAKLKVYDVATDYHEMVIQFGYLSLFSSIWPLTPLAFFINNWVELRSDAMKIAITSQRPIPWRSDSIGPWLNALGFLSRTGSIVSSALVFLFSGENDSPGGDPANVNVVGLLLTLLSSEFLYLGAQSVVSYSLAQIDSPGLQKERVARYSTRKQLLEETLGPDAMKETAPPTLDAGEKITLAAPQREAKSLSAGANSTPEQK